MGAVLQEDRCKDNIVLRDTRINIVRTEMEQWI